MSTVTIDVLPSLRQTKAAAKRAATQQTQRRLREMETSSRQAAWYASVTGYQPLLATSQLSRADRVRLHRLRLGYRTWKELQDDFTDRACDHCDRRSHCPLVHYLLTCPATQHLRHHIDGAPEEEEARAMHVVRHALENPQQLLEVMRAAPPPR